MRTPAADDVPAMVRSDERSFGKAWDPADLEREMSRVDLDRFRVAVDRGEIVGVAGSFGFETTVHGGATIPTGGVTWVSVVVTHRRQGLLGRLIDAVHADIDARGEALATLTASEGGIYERFGYGITWHQRVVEIETRRAVLRPEFRPAPGAVRLMDARESPDELFEAICKNWERYRLAQPGELSRPEAWHRLRMQSYPSLAMYAVHADGHAIWSVGDAEWTGTQP
ncbi:MAG TPA: GNAT family N-acetyltransferase, partial [Ilumatobacteraceae bacterium]